MASEQNLPLAYLARVPFPAGDKVSAVLVPRSMGFLAVRVLHDGWPVIGRQVQFYLRQENAEDEKGDALGEPIRTDDDGVARLPRLVAVDSYVCEIDGQETAVVATVNRLADAAVLSLPIGCEVIHSNVDWAAGLGPAQPEPSEPDEDQKEDE